MNKVVHFEIPANDMQRAEKFYSSVFGWKITKIPMPEGEYAAVSTVKTDDQQMPMEAGAINGGIMRRDKTGKHPVIVIEVPSLNDHLKKVKQADGKIVMPKQSVLNTGLYARVTDTEGNIIGVWQNLR